MLAKGLRKRSTCQALGHKACRPVTCPLSLIITSPHHRISSSEVPAFQHLKGWYSPILLSSGRYPWLHPKSNRETEPKAAIDTERKTRIAITSTEASIAAVIYVPAGKDITNTTAE